MKKVLAAIAIVLVSLAGLALMAGMYWLNSETSVEEIGKPPAEMAKKSGVPFPAAASNIHYFLYSGGMQDLELYFKFDCPTGQTDKIVADLIAANDKLAPGAVAPARREVMASPDETMGTKDLKIPWWNPDESRISKAILLMRPFAMQFWIMPGADGLTTVYVYQND